MLSKLGILSLFGSPLLLNGSEKSISSNVSNIWPPPETCAPLFRIPKYLSSSLSPLTGILTEKSHKETEGLLPGILIPYVFAIWNNDCLCCAKSNIVSCQTLSIWKCKLSATAAFKSNNTENIDASLVFLTKSG